MLSMNINGQSELVIDDTGKVKVSKDIAQDINDNIILSDEDKKPDFNIIDEMESKHE